MKKKEPSLFSLAKYTNREITMESQYMSAGAHHAKLMEKFEKNKNYIRNQAIAMKIVSAVLMLFMPMISFIFYFDIFETLGYSPISIEGTIIVFSMFIMVFYIILMLYIILFGLFSISSLMTGNAFKWIQTLPLSQNKIRKLGFITLFRSQGVMILFMIFSFPITLLIMTQNLFTFSMSLISSFLLTIFSVSLLIVIGERFSHLFSEGGTKSAKKNIFRILSLLSYFIIAFGSGLLLNLSFGAIEDLIYTFSISPPSEIFLFIISVIPFPLAPGFLVGLTMIPGEAPAMVWMFTVIGVIVFALITYLTYRLAIKALKTVSISDVVSEPIEKPLEEEAIEIKLDITNPVKAYIKKDLVASSKDYQSLIFILMPIVYPLVLLFTLSAPISNEVNSPISIMILWASIIGLLMFIPPMLVGGLLSIDESGSTVLASLPIVPRQQFKAKAILMLFIHSISLIIIAITLSIQTQSIIVLLLMLSSLPIAWSFLLIIFVLKIYLFGKLKNKYVLEEFNNRHKIIKWIGVIGSEVVFYFVILIFNSFIFMNYGIFSAIISCFIVGLGSLSILVYALLKMFPKIEKIRDFETGGYLRNHPIIGGLVILILFNVFMILGELTEILFLPLMVNLSYLGIRILEFILIEIFIILLFIYIVPIGMKLPSKNDSLSGYLKEIGLSRFKPLGENIFLGVAMFLIFGLVVFFGGNLFGEFVFIPEILIGTPNPIYPGILSFGWFIWIFMLRPGIWEEVAFRGINIPMLLKKKNQISTILISGLLFGLAHAFNLMTVLLSGSNPIYTLYQVIYTSFLGFSLGYVFIRTKSLIPCIIFHYLIDTVGLVLINYAIGDPLLIGVYLILFLGVIPSILNILFVHYFGLWKKTRE